MSDYVKSNIGSGYNTVSSINTELENIETAIGTKMDKEGTTMSGDLDMGGNDILNAGEINGTEISANTIVVNGSALTGGGSTDASANYSWTGQHEYTSIPTVNGVEVVTGNTLREQTITVTTQNTNYVPVLADQGTLILMDTADPNFFTVPLNSIVAFPVGATLSVCQKGTGQTTITGEVGVTVNTAVGYNLIAQHDFATLVKIGADEWLLSGGLQA